MLTEDTETTTVCRCNRLFGEHTLHPLACVIDLSKPCRRQAVGNDCYAVLLAGCRDGDGCGEPCACDYTSAAALFAQPGRKITAEGSREGRLLLFHPDLARHESLGAKLGGYTFFGYDKAEALRLSAREKRLLERSVDYIDEELHWGIDRFSRQMLCNKIELTLNYCRRFYERQFILRHDMSLDTIAKTKAAIDAYLRAGRAAAEGLPTEAMVADWAGHSAAYTSDMLRHETGFATADYVEARRWAVAKQMLLGTRLATAEISARLGFRCKATFRRTFTQLARCTPAEYRHR